MCDRQNRTNFLKTKKKLRQRIGLRVSITGALHGSCQDDLIV
jgi:hypothetical protein